MAAEDTTSEEWYSSEPVEDTDEPDIGLTRAIKLPRGLFDTSGPHPVDHPANNVDAPSEDPDTAQVSGYIVRGPEGDLTLTDRLSHAGEADTTFLSQGPASTSAPSALGLDTGKERVAVHEQKMQTRILLGIGLAFLLIVLAYVVGQAAHWMTESAADKLLQAGLPPILSAAAVVVGYAFGSRGR
jgi:hypothetical protein